MVKNSQVFQLPGWLDSDKPEDVVGFLLKSLQHSFRQSVDEALRREGVELSFAHFAALFGLNYEPGITGAQLARRALVSAQTMNAVLRRLEDDGLVARRPHPESRRADSWQVTDEGVRQLARARAVGRSVVARMLSALSEKEVTKLQSYLSRCIAALGADAMPPPRALRAAEGAAAKRLQA